MSHKKNLSAKEISEKFGVPVSEGDLNPAFDKDSKYLNQMADLSEFAAELEKKKQASQAPAAAAEPEKPETEKTFAELFEEKSKHVDPEARPQERPVKKPAAKKGIVEIDDEMDFGKLFNSSSMKVVDKDAFAMPDKDYEPFEMNEEDVKAAGKTEFHGFEDFANAFGGKKHKK